MRADLRRQKRMENRTMTPTDTPSAAPTPVTINRPVTTTTVKGKGKGKVFPYSLPSVGPGADPGVQAVSPQVT